ncbi:hypothetical protein ACG0Z5_04410 [Scandinavium sp. M-37]|uniref:hypothetical protein n=1 Tax=Scandinavium sp. M-37 TaxID=3373077 RepID=UPI003744C880
MKALEKYYEALDRLIKNTPNIVSKGTKISYDSVSLEAGQSKGSIKKSRPVFSDLIQTIDRHKVNKKVKSDLNTSKLNLEIQKLKKSLNDSLSREINLINEIHELRKNEINSESTMITELVYLISNLTKVQQLDLITTLKKTNHSFK